MRDLTYQLDPALDHPMYEQLYRQIARDILQGRLPGGSRLPSRRVLSAHLGISGQTVDSALDLLKAEGFVRSSARSGYFVEDILPLPDTPKPSGSARPAAQAPPRHDFSPQSTDIQLFPYRVWTQLIRETLLRESELMNRGHPQGEPGLRQALASFLYQYRGVRTQAEQLVISSGVDQLLATVAALFDQPQLVACEDPGYVEARRVFGRSIHRVCALPLDEQGLPITALEASGAQLVYLTPAHQFPTGISMPAGRRAELLHWAARGEGRYLIEDDYDSEFRYTSRPLPALQGMDAHSRVIYMSTFSRTLAPGVRIAYMALPEDLRRRYQALQLRSGEAVSRYEQRAMARLLEEGHYTRHLRKASRVYQRRCEALCGLLQALPGAWLMGQEAGLHFLFGVDGRSEEALIQPAAAMNIPLQGLRQHCQAARPRPALVLGFGGLTDSELVPAVGALRAAWGL